jgi:Caspase domain
MRYVSLWLFLVLAIGRAASADAQALMKMNIKLGAPTEFDIDVEYHDPGQLDPRLQGSRVLPISLAVTNVSNRTLRFDYKDVRLDLGTAGQQTPLVPVDADDARRLLIQNGAFNAFARLFASRDRIVGEPFQRRLPDGELAPRQSKSGYVFFLRRDGVPFTGFMAVGTVAHGSELLPTATVDVHPAPTTRSVGTAAAAVQAVIAKTAQRVGQTIDELVYPMPFGQSYAILFGISNYDSKTPLPGVERDVANMKAFLEAQGFALVLIKANRDVTADTLRNVQRHFDGKLKKQDRLLVYYAGHGARVADRGYIVLATSGDTLNPKTSIPMDEFVAWMRGLDVKHLLVILDACYSGTAVPGATRAADLFAKLDRTDYDRLYQLASQKAKYVLMAGTDTQRANEDQMGGLFTHALLTALKERPRASDGQLITTNELYSRAKRIVLDEVRSRHLAEQVPVLKDVGIGTSTGEFVFVRPN